MAAAKPKPAKMVYVFAADRTEGGGELQELLGGKGANLAEMASLGLPVPPGFTITTEVCTAYYANGRKLPDGLKAEVEQALARRRQGRRRHASAIGQPAAGLGALGRARLDARHDGHHPQPRPQRRDGRRAWPPSRATRASPTTAIAASSRCIGDVVLGVDHGVFEDILENHKNLNGFYLDTDLGADDWLGDHRRLQGGGRARAGKPFPQDTSEQLWGAIGAVFGSWHNRARQDLPPPARHPRRAGARRSTCRPWCSATSATSSATGVAFTRNPSTGASEIYGEFLINAQGEDVVAGIRTPQPLTEAARGATESEHPSLEAAMPDAFSRARAVFARLEKHYRDMQDIEFTIQDGKLWMLQTRSGKRTTEAALKIAVDLAAEGLITRDGGGAAHRSGGARPAAAPDHRPRGRESSS